MSKHILQFISTILLLSLSLMVLVVLVYSYTHAPVVAVVKGNSMLPLLREGDIVFISTTPPEDIKPGDIVVFKGTKGNYIIHRVVEVVNIKGKYYYVTKGDNNQLPDVAEFENNRGVPYERIVGKVVSLGGSTIKIPYLGNLALMLRG